MKQKRRTILLAAMIFAVLTGKVQVSAEGAFLRFQTVEKIYAVADVNLLTIYEKKDRASAAVGSLRKGGLCYVLESGDPSWYYVESGVVRGFAQTDGLLLGEAARAYVAAHEERNLTLARAVIPPWANAALTYTQTTVRTTLVAKEYAVSKADSLNIREQAGTDARIVGRLPKGGLCCVLEDVNPEWAYVESGNVRGFVSSRYLIRSSAAAQIVAETGAAAMPRAKVQIVPEENAAWYYTITSAGEDSAAETIRAAMVEYALQFVGNPYVWGGVSLTEGADCSGFVQAVYAAFGYAIPRVADAQSRYGTQIPVSEAEPGDLIFYAKDGCVSHVAMYIGNGQVVEAANSSLGIITSGVDSGNAVWATSPLAEMDAGNL
ncbi:MAG: C40 family peptidase [Eubacteriales bacterium]|nr:C40 family peptidase [Eubacteriales bacterium]